MSPTLLELAVVILLIVVAWQLGLTLAPIVLRELRTMRQSLDDVSEDSLATPNPSSVESSPIKKEAPHEP
ncbi:MAG: hypothetical protein HGA19_21845 [Oscillochloris sp.]|nr:hypothetical protein [Oscillochloris sp.]